MKGACAHGEKDTGVRIMRVDEQLDHGPIVSIEKTAIGPDEHAPSLSNRLSKIGANVLLRTLASDMHERPQDHSQATLAPKIEKSEGEIRWSGSAAAVD